jgi:hypothetical protein
MVMTPLGALVGGGIPPVAAPAGTAALAMGAMAGAILVAAAVVILVARRGRA